MKISGQQNGLAVYVIDCVAGAERVGRVGKVKSHMSQEGPRGRSLSRFL